MANEDVENKPVEADPAEKAKAVPAEKTPPEPMQDPTVEELAAEGNLPGWALAGVMTANNWVAGKRLPKKEFKDAVEQWLNGPMST